MLFLAKVGLFLYVIIGSIYAQTNFSIIDEQRDHFPQLPRWGEEHLHHSEPIFSKKYEKREDKASLNQEVYCRKITIIGNESLTEEENILYNSVL